ncbi:phosphatase 2C-like domain-containing protein [Aspergillus unguis]
MDGLASNVIELHAAGGRSAQGSRPEQQDEFVILPPEELPSELKDTVALFGVFDGHGSDAVSKFAKAHLPHLIISSPEFHAGDYESAMQKAVNQVDRLLLQGFKKGEDKFAIAGSTASLAVLDLKRGILVVGNVGDSHILMGKRDAAGGFVEKITRLTEDHKPEQDGEKQRIEQAGGQVHCQHDISRIGKSFLFVIHS